MAEREKDSSQTPLKPESPATPQGKRVADSKVILSQSMQPEHANNLGNVHGGVIMKLIDEAGAACATRHARHRAVTVAVDSLNFMEPVHLGDFVVFDAKLTYVGKTSMETEVNVIAENPLTGEQKLTNSAYLVYVALDENKKPVAVPPLLFESDEERAKAEDAKKRQAERLVRRQESKGVQK